MYSKKTLKFAFSLDTGNGQIEELTLDNVKSFVRTNSYGGYGGVEAECALYGLSLELIGMLSPKDYSSLVLDGRQFDIAIYSGDILIFEGAVRSAYANMNTMPESPFVIQALAASDLRAKVIPPISRTGVVNVSDLLDSLCQQNGYTFQPNLLGGLTESNPYYAGSVFAQIAAICLSHRLEFQPVGKIIHVWPAGKTRDAVMPKISAENGLIGYPIHNANGLTFQTQYSPLLAFGRSVSLDTSLPGASGLYLLTGVEHFLSSWVQGGNWHSVCNAVSVEAYERNKQP
ncbi:hypothetical protein [Candidatus Arsenophonus triatominarum]|uniref:hypothetical protein n=1 Tax=Candidatus Arsenophonus triatominarum TaxID=57911 RepID=UPI0007C5B6A7|nr:hypothetical protein [Candidatus Arsenophonus triatominarum]